MQHTDHSLPHPSMGRHTTLTSLQFGVPGPRPKCIQVGLHAQEIPAVLAAHRPGSLLEVAGRDGRLRGQVVLVPVANPIGLARRVDHEAMGRFGPEPSEPFKRQGPNLAGAAGAAVRGKLPDA